MATYACNAGFILDLSVGSETITCIDDGDMDAEGVFTFQAPQCIRKSMCIDTSFRMLVAALSQVMSFLFMLKISAAIECLPLAAIANGVITYAPDNTPNYTLGTVATYACNAGFILDLSVSSETGTCIDDGDMDAEGVFTLQAPQCVRKSMCNHSVETSLRMLVAALSQVMSFLFMLKISAAIECLPLAAIANGVITYAPDNTSNYSLGTEATYACNAGFILDLSVGSETRTCIDDGDMDAEEVFTFQAPQCIRKSMRIETSFRMLVAALSQVMSFLFMLKVSAAIECLPLAAIADGVITYAPDNTPNYTLGTVATYACDAGFILDLSVGSETRTCIDDGDMDAEGVFDFQEPQCVRKSRCNRSDETGKFNLQFAIVYTVAEYYKVSIQLSKCTSH